MPIHCRNYRFHNIPSTWIFLRARHDGAGFRAISLGREHGSLTLDAVLGLTDKNLPTAEGPGNCDSGRICCATLWASRTGRPLAGQDGGWAAGVVFRVFPRLAFQLEVPKLGIKVQMMPFRRSLKLHSVPPEAAPSPFSFLAPSLRFGPKRSLALPKASFTNSLLPITAPSVK